MFYFSFQSFILTSSACGYFSSHKTFLCWNYFLFSVDKNSLVLKLLLRVEMTIDGQMPMLSTNIGGTAFLQICTLDGLSCNTSGCILFGQPSEQKYSIPFGQHLCIFPVSSAFGHVTATVWSCRFGGLSGLSGNRICSKQKYMSGL